jgi:hypothetical protein
MLLAFVRAGSASHHSYSCKLKCVYVEKLFRAETFWGTKSFKGSCEDCEPATNWETVKRRDASKP